MLNLLSEMLLMGATLLLFRRRRIRLSHLFFVHSVLFLRFIIFALLAWRIQLCSETKDGLARAPRSRMFTNVSVYLIADCNRNKEQTRREKEIHSAAVQLLI